MILNETFPALGWISFDELGEVVDKSHASELSTAQLQVKPQKHHRHGTITVAAV